MPKPVIALDADGVLLDYSLAYAGAWQRAFGRRPALRDPDAYWPIDRWHVEHLEDDERLAQLRRAFDDEFWSGIPAIAGAVEACVALDAAGYELPFTHIEKHVRPVRATNKDKSRRLRWWLHGRVGSDIRAAVVGLNQVIVTPRVAKHRIFVWGNPRSYYDDATVTITRADDTTFGILHSRFHELWSLRMCTFLGVGNDPRYTPTTCFETFPFPVGLTPQDTKNAVPDTPAAQAIAAAAQKLDQLRSRWLNPPEWVDWAITAEEEKAGFPKRPVAKPGHEADLRKRTLTNLYNARPAWLALAHEALDHAVAAAYGWKDYHPQWPDEDILRRLLALNQQRSKK